jgi:hypothetical protein
MHAASNVIHLVRFNSVRFGLIWFGLAWFGLVWFGLVWSQSMVAVSISVHIVVGFFFARLSISFRLVKEMYK